MNKKTVGYWVVTALAGVAMFGSGLFDLTGGEQIKTIFQHLGFPVALALFLGVAKLAGAVVILLPGLPRLKEWAYAGLTFDLVGAAYAHAIAGDPAANVATPVVLAGLVLASWALRPANRRLA